MFKKPIGALDTITGTFIAAPKIDYRAMLKISAHSIAPPAPSPSAQTPFDPAILSATAAPAGHLHFGGSQVRSGNGIGAKPQSGRTFRQQRRLELMVQMENAQIPEHMMAPMLGISLTRVKQIKKTLDYQKARIQITLGIVVDHGQRLEQIKEQRKEALTQMLPQALQVIAHVVSRPTASLNVAEQKLQVAVAQDLLDREGSLAKISKSEVKQVDNFNWNHIDSAGRSIMDTIRGTYGRSMSSARASEIQDTINLSQDFSNSRTLSVKEQQAALDELEREALAQAVAAPPRFQN